MNDNDIILQAKGLKKHFVDNETFLHRLIPGLAPQYVRAVDGVDLEIRRGETLALVGESGCGKSTLARTILRLIEPTDGEIYIDGENITEYSKKELQEVRSKAQLIYQDPFASLNPRYTIKKTLVEPMKVHNRGNTNEERTKIAADLIERVGLKREHLDRYPHEFSGGQRQRIGIARALSVEPELIVADEPTSALDVSMQSQLLNLLDELKETLNLSILYITHDLSLIRHIADRGSVMYLGNIVETAPVENLFLEPKHPYSQALFSSIQLPDPTAHYERIPLVGDVPTPIDPPSGCSFHPRCHQVIPPENWPSDQTTYQTFLQFKKQALNKNIDKSAIREQLQLRQGTSVADSDIIEFLYQEHIESELEDDAILPEEVRSTIESVLQSIVSDNYAAAVDQLEQSYTSVCEQTVPEQIDLNSNHCVDCHHYNDEVNKGVEIDAWSPLSSVISGKSN
ncbi:ABC transporter ATP-binding protein [Natrialbaceae archaeon A-CW1-1]